MNKRRSTMNSRTRLSTVFHGIYTVLIAAFAILGTIGIIYDLPHIHVTEDVIGEGVKILYTLLFWCILFFEIRTFGSRLYLDGDGIGIKRFRKIKVYLRWPEICEMGIGYIPTPVGNKKRLYLSAKHLSDDQKHDLLTLKYETVHFSYLPKGWAKIICEKCANAAPLDGETLRKWEKT